MKANFEECSPPQSETALFQYQQLHHRSRCKHQLSSLLKYSVSNDQYCHQCLMWPNPCRNWWNRHILLHSILYWVGKSAIRRITESVRLQYRNKFPLKPGFTIDIFYIDWFITHFRLFQFSILQRIDVIPLTCRLRTTLKLPWITKISMVSNAIATTNKRVDTFSFGLNKLKNNQECAHESNSCGLCADLIAHER